MFSWINCSTKGRTMITSQKAQDKKEKIQVLSLAKERYSKQFDYNADKQEVQKESKNRHLRWMLQHKSSLFF
jgi:hypothetical protein